MTIRITKRPIDHPLEVEYRKRTDLDWIWWKETAKFAKTGKFRGYASFYSTDQSSLNPAIVEDLILDPEDL